MVNLKPSVFLFIGDDNYSKEEAVKTLSSSLKAADSNELDYKVFYGGKIDVMEALEHVKTVPFLSEKRLIVIKEFEKLSREDKDRISEYIKNPSKSTCLVLESPDESVLQGYDNIASRIN